MAFANDEKHMTGQTAAEVRQDWIAKMGPELGGQFDALWREVAWLHQKWGQFVELFGTNPARIDLLNATAPSFFRIVQDTAWDEALLHLARLTDRPVVMGHANLTIQNLPDLVDDLVTKDAVTARVASALTATEFCRDWRNRHIAHRDLALATNASAAPLARASRNQINEALDAIAATLNEVQGRYMDGGTHFRAISSHTGAAALLYVLHDGHRAQQKRQERLKRGELDEDDYPPHL